MNFSWSFTIKGKALFWTVALMFCGVGIVFAFLVPSLVMEPGADKIHVKGKVIDNSKKGYLYYPVVEFTAADGETVETDALMGSPTEKYQPGTPVYISYKRSNPDAAEIINDKIEITAVMKILGWIFLSIGGVILLMTITALYIKIKYPQNEAVFYWWINFTGGLMGAFAFSLPSTFIYPIFILIPASLRQNAQNTDTLLLVFTGVGILVNIAVFFIGRSQYRSRPRWSKQQAK